MSGVKRAGKGNTHECALVFQDGDNVRIVGGQKIGYPTHHRTNFCLSGQPNRRPSVGIRIYFPRSAHNAVAFAGGDGKPSPALVIEIRLHVGTWTSTADEVSDKLLAALPARETTKTAKMCVLRLRLNDGEKAAVDGLGFPFIGNGEDDGIVNHGHLMEGVKSLRDICTQTEFTLLFGGAFLIPKGRTNFKQDFPDPVREVFPYSAGYVHVIPHPFSLVT